MRGRGAEEESGWDKEARRDGTEWRVGSLCSGPPALQSACYLGLIWADTWAGSGLLFATIVMEGMFSLLLFQWKKDKYNIITRLAHTRVYFHH